MGTLKTTREEITEHIPEVLRQFNAATEQEPWIHLPPDYRVVFLGELMAFAADLALGDTADAELCRRMLHTAVRHGEARLSQGFPDSLIYHEYHLLRQAFRSYLREHHDAGDLLVSEAIIRVDAALSLASKGSLRGYHRSAFQERGRWPQAIEELVGEWRPLPPVE